MAGAHEMQFDFYPLLRLIDDGKNEEAKSMLGRDLCKALIGKFGSFLHYTAARNNATITQHLIDMGSDIDSLEQDGETPLMLAVERQNTAIVKILLEAGANIDTVGANGKSALQMALHPRYSDSMTVEAFLHRVKAEVSSTEELIERLFAAGCALHHIVRLKEVSLLKGLLQRGSEVDSTNCIRQTALHTALELGDLEIAKILIENGAKVNAFDMFGNAPLYYAVNDANVAVMQFLLEEGADLIKRSSNEYSPLLALYYDCGRVNAEQLDRCVTILLQHGAVPTNECVYDRTILDLALGKEGSRAIDYLIAHLAVLEMIGTPTTESVVRYSAVKNTWKIKKLEETYKLCQQTLKIIIFNKLSLLNLLTDSECKMRLHVRNETLVSKVKDFCTEHGLDKLCFYYHDTLMKRIFKAARTVKLEDEAVPVISEIFQRNENECYVAARKICGYLSEWDLKRLCRL